MNTDKNKAALPNSPRAAPRAESRKLRIIQEKIQSVEDLCEDAKEWNNTCHGDPAPDLSQQEPRIFTPKGL